MELHVLDHPFPAISIAVIPSAVSSTLLWPDINHFSDVIGWVSQEGAPGERGVMEEELAPIIWDVVIYPQQEKLVFQPDIPAYIR